MRGIIVGSTLALFVAGAATAQGQGNAAQAMAHERTTIATGNEARHACEADARHCLDLKSDREIIRCAEPYRYRGTGRR